MIKYGEYGRCWRCGGCEEVWGVSVGKVSGRCQVSVGEGEGRCGERCEGCVRECGGV